MNKKVFINVLINNAYINQNALCDNTTFFK